MICPKCAFEQPESLECARCGIVFSRYRGPAAPQRALTGSGIAPHLLPVAPAPPPVLVPPRAAPEASAGGVERGRSTAAFAAFEPAPVGYVIPHEPPPQPAPAPLGGAGGRLYEPQAPAATAGYARPSPSPTAPARPVAATRTVAAQTASGLTPGKILSETFSIYVANFAPFSIIAGLALAPFVLLMLFFLASPETHPNGPLLASLTDFLVLLLATPLTTAAITYGVLQEMRGREASAADCLRIGLSSIVSVLGVVIVQALAELAPWLLPVTLLVAVPSLISIGRTLIGVALACLVATIYIAIKFYVAVPAAVEERHGAIEAMRRGSFLTSDFRGQVFGFVFMLGLASFVLSYVAARLTGAAGLTPGALVTSNLVRLLTTALGATGAAILYYRLRGAKESVDVGEIASVFD